MTQNIDEQVQADIANILSTHFSPPLHNYPKQIRTLLRPMAIKGDLPIGVYLDNTRYKAQVTFNGKQYNLGRYTTPMQAHSAWQLAKALAIEEEVTWWFEHPAAGEDFDHTIAAHLLTKAAMLKFHARHGIETTAF